MKPDPIDAAVDSLLIAVAPRSRDFARDLLRLAYRQGVADTHKVTWDPFCPRCADQPFCPRCEAEADKESKQ